MKAAACRQALWWGLVVAWLGVIWVFGESQALLQSPTWATRARPLSAPRGPSRWRGPSRRWPGDLILSYNCSRLS